LRKNVILCVVIDAILGCTPKAVETRLHRAPKALPKKLAGTFEITLARENYGSSRVKRNAGLNLLEEIEG
jgi:hypothetical protein